MSWAPARPWRWHLRAAAFAAAAAVSPPAAAQPLAVPYLPQTEALCGGAAAAMVMRYWGDTDAYPDAFAPLVEAAAGGIRTSALASALERRGWTVAAGPGSDADMTTELGRRRPVIALIEDRPGRYHYVVVVGRADGKVLLHDPARAPSRAVDAARFDAQWRKSERWMLILLPGTAGPTNRGASDPRPAVTRPARAEPSCGLVDEGVAKASEDRAAARATLERATAACPHSAAPWRELAGLDALEARWTDAAGHAERAVAIDPDDAHAWRILGTARYLAHDDLAALAAWNRIGEPALNLIDITGLAATRYAVVASAIGVDLRSMLTPRAMRLAERRVRQVPAIAAARVTFQPIQNGRARIDAALVERDRAPSGYGGAVRLGFGALTDRELAASFANVSGGGDLAGVAWRWWERRPKVSAFYAAPAPHAIGGGVMTLDAFRETQTFGRARLEETRTHAGLALGNWVGDRTRVTGGAAIERWRGRLHEIALSGGVEHWIVVDRVKIAADLTQWLGTDAFASSAFTAAARSKPSARGALILGIAGLSVASESAPASIWPGADTGHARDVLLRAHPLLDHGVMTGGAFGRTLAFGTVEAQRWTLLRSLPVRWAPAAFVDAARATRGLADADTRMHLDAGVGVRLALPGGGVMRVDVAHGLRGGGTAVSAGWDRRW